MNFVLYKNYLIDYLSKCGHTVKNENGLNCCFSPTHQDKNPSCQISQSHFNCYSCGISGDIYDAVGILEGITDRKQQYLHLEKIYGGNYTPTPIVSTTKNSKSDFEPDPDAINQIQNYLENHKARKSQVLNFIKQRASTASGGKVNNYSEEIAEKLTEYFAYWPGVKTAIQDGLSMETLQKAGITKTTNINDKASWKHSGIVLSLGTGFKLHYYRDGKCEKRGSIGCNTFPMPGTLKDKKTIILVEGEIDAVICRAAGFDAVYSTGGTQGLTKPKIKTHILSSSVQEIIILYDNDAAGKKASGLIDYDSSDKNKTNLPTRLIQAGFTGTIKLASLEEFKDPDEAVLYGRIDLIKKAIDQAQEYNLTIKAKEQKSDIPEQNNSSNGIVPLKLAEKILKLLPKDTLMDYEVQPFIDALIKAVPAELAFDIKSKLQTWGASQEQLNKPHKVIPSYIVDVCKAHDISYYYIKQIEQKTITKEGLLLTTEDKPITTIKYELIDNTPELKVFIYKRGEKATAALLAKLLVNKLIYIETDKKFFHFNGLVWERVSDITGIAYNLLKPIILHYIKTTDPGDSNRLKNLHICLNKIEEYRFCKTIMQAVSEKPEIFREQITFDGPAIQETLTLQDGVIDFSGKEIHYRNARPEEYRLKTLPYTIDQVKTDKKPTKFIKFMRGNFRNEGTYETLMYYLSLLPSRRAKFKVGGIFVGVSNTGKTTTMNIISKIYPEMIAPIPRELIMSTRYGNSNLGPNPYIARLEGAGAGLSDETQRNDTLNSAIWKQLTGGGILTARGMYSNPRNFMPTAQIIILTNFSPKFDGKDQATINRMVVIPFNVQHLPNAKDTMEEKDLEKMLEPEYPSVVRLFAEYYINLKTKHNSKIPLSAECEGYKQDYVENQETDLDRFVTNNIEFIKDENVFVPLKDIYIRFAQFNKIELDEYGKPLDKEDWSQSKFTRYFKGDYNEVRIKQKKINGKPEQIVLNARLKDIEPLKTSSDQQPEPKAPKQQTFSEIPFEPQEEIPF